MIIHERRSTKQKSSQKTLFSSGIWDNYWYFLTTLCMPDKEPNSKSKAWKVVHTFPDWSTVVTTDKSCISRLIAIDDKSPIREYNNLEIEDTFLDATIQNLEITYFKNKALRYNEWKTRWSLVDWKSMEPMVQVLEFWAKKYSEDNWRNPMDKKQILNSMMRHMVKLMDWEEIDSESGLGHIWHIMANALFYSFHSKSNDSK